MLGMLRYPAYIRSLLRPGDAVGIVLSGATLQEKRTNNPYSEQYHQSKPRLDCFVIGV